MVSTGYKGIDGLLSGGLEKGKLYALGCKADQVREIVTANLAERIASHDSMTLLASYPGSHESFEDLIMSKLTGIQISTIRSLKERDMTQFEATLIGGKLKSYPWKTLVINNKNTRITDIADLIDDGNYDVVIIASIHEFAFSVGEVGSSLAERTEIVCKVLRRVAKEKGIAIIVTTWLSINDGVPEEEWSWLYEHNVVTNGIFKIVDTAITALVNKDGKLCIHVDKLNGKMYPEIPAIYMTYKADTASCREDNPDATSIL